MRVVHRAQERFLLVIASMLPDWAFRHERLVEFIAVLESPWTHARGRADALDGLLRVRDHERAMFAAEKTSGVKCFEFFAFADIEALADIDERGHRSIVRRQGAGDDGAGVRRGPGL